MIYAHFIWPVKARRREGKIVAGIAVPIVSILSVSKSPFDFPIIFKCQDFIECGTELTSAC